MEHASIIAVEVLKAARRWVASRVVLRRVMDSKSATQPQLNKARADNQKAADELEGLVLRLERFLHNSGTKFPMKRGSQSQFPWRDLFGAVAAVARGAESVLEGTKTPPGIIEAKVIDVKSE